MFAVEVVEAHAAHGMADVLAAQMALSEPPSVLIAPDPHSRGLIAACAAAGVAVPERLSIVSISEAGADAYHRRHAITALAIDPTRMGGAAAQAMLAWLKGGEEPAHRIRVQAAVFTARGTTGRAIRTS